MVLEELFSIAESVQNLSKVHELMHDAQKKRIFRLYRADHSRTTGKPRLDHASIMCDSERISSVNIVSLTPFAPGMFIVAFSFSAVNCYTAL